MLAFMSFIIGISISVMEVAFLDKHPLKFLKLMYETEFGGKHLFGADIQRLFACLLF